jgi:hypothetical protein
MKGSMSLKEYQKIGGGSYSYADKLIAAKKQAMDATFVEKFESGLND